MSEIHCQQLPNGLWLLGEPVASAQSVAMTLLTPSGLAQQPGDQLGVATLLEEMVNRGAGGLSAREHSEALDQLGVQRSTQVESRHLRFNATLLGEKLDQALPLLLDMAKRPNLDDENLAPARALALQSLEAIEDEPQQRVLIELRRRHYPSPLDRSPFGKREHLQGITGDQLRDFWRRTSVPGGSILSFAGRFDWDRLQELVGELTADWQGAIEAPKPAEAPPRGYEHLEAETSQVHIALAYDAVPEDGDRSMLQRAAAAVLSGGMSGRLFTEVREKRGLCYTVMAQYAAHRDLGAVMSYVGTTTPRAQETLDVLCQELRRLSDGIEPSEFQRAVVGMKSQLVMQGESTGARAGAIARDQEVLGRPRTLEELTRRIDAITLEELNSFVREHRPGEMTIVTLGPNALELANA